MVAASSLPPHGGVPKLMPIPKGTDIRAEATPDGNVRLSCAISLEALQVYMRDVATVMRGGELEAPLFFVVHHKNGVRFRVERDPGQAARALAEAMSGVAASIRGEHADAHITAFEFDLACGCGVRVDVVAPWSPKASP